MAITMDGIFVNGQKALFRPEDIIDGDASAYAEAIGSAVGEWMEENVTGGEQVTDTTLTLPGVPADSKVAGAAINSLQKSIIFPTLTSSDFTQGYWAEGQIVTTNSRICSKKMYPVSAGDTFSIIEDGVQVGAWLYENGDVMSTAVNLLAYTDAKPTVYTVPLTGLLLFNAKKSSGSIVPSDFTGSITSRKRDAANELHLYDVARSLAIKSNDVNNLINFFAYGELNNTVKGLSVRASAGIFTMNGTPSNNRVIRLTGMLENTTASAISELETGLQLEEGCRYRVISKITSGTASGSYAYISVYPIGASSTIGTIEVDGATATRTFTAPEGGMVNIGIYASSGNTYNGFTGYVILEKIEDDSGIKSIYADEMADTIAKSISAITEPAVVFPFATDIHRFVADTQTFDDMIDNMAYFTKRVKCDCVACGGDVLEGDQTAATTINEARVCTERFSSLGIPYLFALGNHDSNRYYNSAEECLTDGQVYSAFYQATKMDGYNANKYGRDYYVDFGQDIRIVVLAACSIAANATYSYGSTTGPWLTSTAFNTDRTVIIITHVSPIKEHVWNNNDADKTDSVKTAINGFLQNGGNLIMLTGHSHCDAAWVDPYVEVTCASQKFDNPDVTSTSFQKMTGQIDGLHSPLQTAGDYTQDCWTVCIYKAMSNELDLIRFGAGDDRYIHCTPISPSTVVSKLSGELTWSSSDTSVATVSGGVISGVSSGKCAVVATDANNNRECWVVSVA